MKTTNYCLKPFSLCFVALLAACSSNSWPDAREANTYEAYQAYITDHPGGQHVAEARQRADTLLWNTVQSDTTVQAIEQYVNQFPEGAFATQARQKINQLSGEGFSSRARITGSNVIIRGDHTTEAASVGVIANKGTEVTVLDRYLSANNNEAILKRNVTVTANGQSIALPKGKAITITQDQGTTIQARFTTAAFGATRAAIPKDAIEAIEGERWYHIRTTDDITGWVFGQFVQEL